VSVDNRAEGSLLIAGSGGLARETAEAVRAVNAADGCYELLGFLDDAVAVQGTEVDGVPVLGPIQAAHDFPRARLVVATGRPGDYLSRRRIVERLALPDERYATVVHPAAVAPPSTAVGAGTILLAGVICTTAVRLGRHVAVMPGTVLTHDDEIEDYATVAAGVRVGGSVRIRTGAYLGSGVLIKEGVTIGAWSLLGMGSVVTGSVPPGEVWIGAPARWLRDVRLPDGWFAPFPPPLT
jgi:sugar O-acyltransferase (sialic acid O-acetyltransferase NeuD family)